MLSLRHRNIPITIIGGGIHGCSIAARITREVPHAVKHLAILDRYSQPLLAWNRKTRAQGMTFLRSPAVHHISSDSLGVVEYARTRDRTDELVPPYVQPSINLFFDFCTHEIATQQLQGVYHRFDVAELRWEKGAGAFPFRIISQKNEGFRTACVILAIGAEDCSYVPTEFVGFKHQFPRQILHSREFNLCSLKHTDLQKVAIIGGGLSAATLAKNLTDSGVKTVLITRKPMKVQRFDFEPSWLGPKALRAFREEPDWNIRMETIQLARGEGSVTPEMAQSLAASAASGDICLLMGTRIVEIEGHRQLRITTSEHTINNLDLIILATGYRFNLQRYDFLSHLIKKHRIPMLSGLPLLDENLQLLPVEKLFGSGTIAQLQIGPAAGNIAGTALAYERMREQVLGTIPVSHRR